MIEGIEIYEGKKFKDDRGWFMESWKDDGTIPHTFKQDNISESSYGTLRGLHFQRDPMAQGKLVSCLRGAVFDVAVDIRKDSETFGKWFGIRLSAENNLRMYIPEGFAHGFITLSPDVIFHYKCTEVYSPEHEDTLKWNDTTINIDWPIQPIHIAPKDKKGKTLDEI